MKIELTEQQYRYLLDLVYISAAIATATPVIAVVAALFILIHLPISMFQSFPFRSARGGIRRN